MSLTAARSRKERELASKREEVPGITAANRAEQLEISNEITALDVEINSLVPPKG